MPSRPPAAASPGTGTAPAPGPSQAPVAQSPTYLSMDFTDVDLPVLIKFMSEQTKRNFIFDERVQGKITIISPRRVTLEEAYNVFLSVLQSKGFTTVTQGNTIKIIAAREARQDTIHTGVSKRYPLRGIHHPPRSAAVPREHRGRPAGDAAGLQGRDGLRVRFLQHAAADRLARQHRPDRHDPRGGRQRGDSAGILRIYPLAYAVATDVAKTLTSVYLEAARARRRPREDAPSASAPPAASR